MSLNIQSLSLSKHVEDYLDLFEMLLSSLTKNDDVIKVSKCEVKTIEYLIHEILEIGWSLCQAKWNFQILILAKGLTKAVFLMASLSRAMW